MPDSGQSRVHLEYSTLDACWRAAEVKIQDIRHVGLLSPMIAAHGRFYLEAWGLQAVGEDERAQYLRGSSSEQHILSLHPADRRGLHHLAFSVAGSDAVDAAAAELEHRGVTVVAQPKELDEPGGGYGLRFLDPEKPLYRTIGRRGRTFEPPVCRGGRAPSALPRSPEHCAVRADRGVLR